MNVTLETERLVLRNWSEDDARHYLTLAHDIGYNCFSPPGRYLVNTSEEALQKIRERIALFERERLGKFPIFLKSTGEFAGTCGLEPFELNGKREVNLGYRLCLKHWGQGYAAEAARASLRYGFETMSLKRILAFALAQNRASLKILAGLGFRHLGEHMHRDLSHGLYEIISANFERPAKS